MTLVTVLGDGRHNKRNSTKPVLSRLGRTCRTDEGSSNITNSKPRDFFDTYDHVRSLIFRLVRLGA